MSPTRPHAGAARRARRWAWWVAALLLIVGGCSSGEDAARTTGTAPSTAGQAPRGVAPTLNWTGCGGRLQCASLEVPLDHDDPSGPAIDLAVAIRRRSPTARVGSRMR